MTGDSKIRDVQKKPIQVLWTEQEESTRGIEELEDGIKCINKKSAENERDVERREWNQIDEEKRDKKDWRMWIEACATKQSDADTEKERVLPVAKVVHPQQAPPDVEHEIWGWQWP